MPESESPTKREDEKWITIGGKHMQVNPDEEIEEKTREKLPSLRGEKEKNTKAALSKAYIQRRDLPHTLYKIRDEVVFDEYQKSGVVAGIDGEIIKVFYDGYIKSVREDYVFKKSELLPDYHWDTMTPSDKIIILKQSGIDTSYSTRHWMGLDPHLRNIIKTNSAAGYESTSQGNNNPIYNPISDDKTVSQRIKDEEKKQHEDTDEKTSSTD